MIIFKVFFFLFKNFNNLIYMLIFFFFFLNEKSFIYYNFLMNLNYLMLILIFMSLLILNLIFFSEKSKLMKILSLILVLVSIFFFTSNNIFFLYFLYELSFLPITIMVLSFGYQIEKISASYYLLFYTLICSMPFFFFILNLFSFNLSSLNFFFFSWEMMLLLSFLFMMKFPVFFFHLWLPKAHVEASTTASMLLAGLLLKLGTGGFYRFINLFNFFFLNYYIILSLLGIILSNFYCLFQSDLKSLSAFSSINHMSFVLMILILINNLMLWSSILIMVSHGLISTLMFYFIGEFYHIKQTRLLYYYSSFFMNSLNFSISISLTWLYNSGIPFSLTFFSELMSFIYIFNFNYFFFFIFFLYFFISFYYNLYLITLNYLGMNFLNLNLNLSFYSYYMIFLNSNIFFLYFLI